jgi:hypothetical protein
MPRPKAVINTDEVIKLASINCSVEEIADFFDVHKRTIERRFAAALKKGRSHGKMSLKRKMWTVAMSDGKGSITMLIWLSKQMLGYTDQPKTSIEQREQNVYVLTFDDETESNTPKAA